MIIDIGDIKIKTKIIGDNRSKLEMEARNIFSDYLSENSKHDFLLTLCNIPDASLDSILGFEGKVRLKKIIETIEGRFPFSRIGYRKILSTKWRGERNSNSLVSDNLPNPLFPDSSTDGFVVVPQKNYLLVADPKERRGCAVIKGRNITNLAIVIKSVLQAAFAVFAPTFGGVMFHACSLKIDGDGYVFFGNSGSGKTTIASSVNGDSLLSDDGSMCVVRDDRFLFYPTPFTQVTRYAASGISVPLKMILFLIKDNKDFIEDVRPGAALVRILYNHIHFFRFLPKGEAVSIFQKIEKLVKEIPSYELHFTRNFKPLSFFKGPIYERKKTI
jgi:hypothetical protein